MSTIEEAHELHDETAERPRLVRMFEVDAATFGDGRTVDVRIVPYGETARAADGLGGVARGVAYDEEWLPGVFAQQERAANRVLLNFEHETGLGGIVGHGVALREARDGFHGSFRLHDNADGEKARMLVEEKVLGGVSLEAIPLKSVRTAAGVVQRVRAHLDKVSLCRLPAFKSSVVLALREQAVPELDESLLVVEPDPELLARCRSLGVKLPERYEAHPASGHPGDETGTPEDGTRPAQSTPDDGSADEHHAGGAASR
jgi:HK97 family phage prohead protease